ncbi:TonB-dependent receptor [Vibrio sp. V27_P1S3P104]|uniref:TonB-dependent receptor domain-containing protein n=1 Tax=unclassified Vibrio TaxID=2614977 RepID=UPI000C167DDD|nr:TonB-dependent receptor [Vibrio sp. V28_P6S34P95]NAX05815.1 TonB-dependent receptor [Vibrio sp. V30_P3S12P165]NAX34936.1 TonB-dependent receptor [Vibrio sp. V29_P1S30P107]NAX37011.1 TonB-dependent receptor [Vibrio sp. V27_P1S3P104]NAX39627.1 TonB-dependent receptor [Vibrio sp. V26_P1S5P106]NNN43371.1 TonB-dependent receptor [Vibrio sp. 1-1(7)]NNN71195.1 TonB-dependent receptor [Vibrio sp. 12-2(3-a)]
MQPVRFDCRRKSVKMTEMMTIGLSTVLFTPAFAAQIDASSMETLVVTASGYDKAATEAPASISVIDRVQLDSRSYKDLTDALKDLPGVIITGGGSRQEISLRGMPSEYTVILVDGRKQSGRETQVSSGGGFEQDWLPPLNAIERIEVVRGPMSTLYGSDAIGGVINIITRKDYQQWHGSLRAEATLQEKAQSGDFYQGQLYLAGPLVENLLSASLSGLYQERKEDEILYANGGKELQSYRASLYLTPTDDDTLTFDYTYHDQQRINTENKSRTANAETNNHRRSFGLAHAGTYQWGQGQSYLSHENVENVGRQLEVENTSVNTQWSMPIGEHYLTVGAAYEKQQLDNRQFLFKNRQWSLYAEDEWYLTELFALTAGLRLDNNDQFDTQLSPRLYGVYSLDRHWTLKGGLSTGYRAPSLTEMEGDWVQESCNGRCEVFGNPNLKPETSVNTEIGIYFVGDDSLTSNVTLFYNRFEDKIDKVNLDANCSGRACDATYVNVEDAKTYGAEVSISKNIVQTLDVSATYTYSETEKQSGDDKGLPLTQMPNHLLAINTNWSVVDHLNIWTRTSYRSKEKQAITQDSRNVLAPSVTYFDFGAHWQLNTNVKLMAGIYNLFDKETTYQEYGYVEDGRRYWFAINTTF